MGWILLGNVAVSLFFYVNAYEPDALKTPLGGPVSFTGVGLLFWLPIANLLVSLCCNLSARGDHFAADERARVIVLSRAFALSAFVFFVLNIPGCMLASSMAGEH